jgi:hypothetical protein
MLAVNPIWWLTSRRAHQRVWLWVVVLIVCLGGGVGFIVAQGNSTALGSILVGAIVLHLGLAVWVAFEASNSFAEARGTGAMELLLSTPLPVRQILRGQHLALRELFLGPLILVLCFCLVWFVLDLFAVAEVGMWFGLTAQKPTQALTKTVAFVLVLPLLLVAAPCCWPIGPGLMVAKSVIFFTWAQNKLETEFRRAATERYDLPRTTKWFRRGPPKLRMPGNAENHGRLRW